LIFLPFADDIRDINAVFEAAGYGEEINKNNNDTSILE
jgi:hypothetical protein